MKYSFFNDKKFEVTKRYIRGHTDGTLQESNDIDIEGFTPCKEIIMKKQVIMLDIEDTISNTDHRRNLSPAAQGIVNPKSNDFDDWNGALPGDPITDLVPIIKLLAKKYEIVISSAKPLKYKDMAEEYVKKALGFVPEIFLMRESGENILPSKKLKELHKVYVENTLERKIAFCIDDRKDVCELYNIAWNYNKNIYWESSCPIVVHTIVMEFGGSEEHPERKEAKEITFEEARTGITFDEGDTKSSDAGDILANAAKIFKAKGEEYGNSYHTFGDLCFNLFPQGLELKTAEDMNRWAVLELILVKIQRYSNHFLTGGHKDSLDDLIVYTAMLQELDSLIKSDT